MKKYPNHFKYSNLPPSAAIHNLHLSCTLRQAFFSSSLSTLDAAWNQYQIKALPAEFCYFLNDYKTRNQYGTFQRKFNIASVFKILNHLKSAPILNMFYSKTAAELNSSDFFQFLRKAKLTKFKKQQLKREKLKGGINGKKKTN